MTTKVAAATNAEAPLSNIDEIHVKKKEIAAKINKIWTCKQHSLPDKPVLCWRERDNNGNLFGPCYPITVSNVNFWTTLSVRILIVSIVFSPN